MENLSPALAGLLLRDVDHRPGGPDRWKLNAAAVAGHPGVPTAAMVIAVRAALSTVTRRWLPLVERVAVQARGIDLAKGHASSPSQ